MSATLLLIEQKFPSWSGALKVTASDGDVRVIEPGMIWLMTDTQGKGHESEVVSSVPFEAVIVFLPNPN